MTDSDKKQWSTPKLRVFARTRAEERVLYACKNNGFLHQAANSSYATCYRTSADPALAGCEIACSSPSVT
jgi:hypothetical protein